MRTSEFLEENNPDFQGFVIGSVEIEPNVFRIRRIPKEFLLVTGPPGPPGPAGPGTGDMLKSVYDPTSVDERLIGVTEYAAGLATLNASIATKADDAATTAALATKADAAATTAALATKADDAATTASFAAVSAALATKQPLDATLTALAAYNTNGLLTQTAADTFVGRTLTGTSDQITVANGDGVAANPTVSLATNAKIRQFGITIDGGGSAVTTGLKGFIRVPQAMTITGWEVVADIAGNIVIDAWKDTYGNFPPDVGDSFVGGVKPTLAGVDKNQNLALNVAVAAGDYVAFNVDSAATVTRVHLAFFGTLI